MGAGSGSWRWELEVGAGGWSWWWELDVGAGCGSWMWELDVGAGGGPGGSFVVQKSNMVGGAGVYMQGAGVYMAQTKYKA